MRRAGSSMLIGVVLLLLAAPQACPQGPILVPEYEVLPAPDPLDWKPSPEDSAASGAAREDALASAPLPIRQAVDRINAVRRSCRLPRVALDAELSLACEQHARYLSLNRRHPSTHGMGAHDESEELSGFSPQGRRAATTSNIVWGETPLGAVNLCLSGLYHRVPLLRPSLLRVGVACHDSITVIDVLSGTIGDDDRPVAFPNDAVTGVPTSFRSEVPNPLPPGVSRAAGFPITLQFPLTSPDAHGIRASLRESGGNSVPYYLSSPEQPATEYPQQNTICLIPEAPLSHGTGYEVTISGWLGDRKFVRTWSFVTGNEPATPLGRPPQEETN